MRPDVARRIVDISVVLAMSLVAWATPALAGAPSSQATDPTANSPAGVVYSIPLDSARQDAAPHGHGSAAGGVGGGSGGSGGGTGGSGGGASGSSGSGASGSSGSGASGTPSGNGATGGGGSSGSHGKPVAASSGAGRSAGTGSHAAVLVPGGQPGSLIHSSNGFGSSSRVPGLNAPSGSGLDSVQGNAGSAPLLAILLALVVFSVGAFAGVRASRETAH
jgi:hypothetical protein